MLETLGFIVTEAVGIAELGEGADVVRWKRGYGAAKTSIVQAFKGDTLTLIRDTRSQLCRNSLLPPLGPRGLSFSDASVSQIVHVANNAKS